MANYKKRKAWHQRNRCHMCKYFKGQGTPEYERQKFNTWRRMQKSERDWR